MELELIKKLAEYPEEVVQSAEHRAPSSYCFVTYTIWQACSIPSIVKVVSLA